MSFLNKLMMVLAALAVQTAVAQESNSKASGETKAKIEDVREGKNTVAGNIDEEITNAKLRAESGSKSKFSLSARVDYTGGSFTRPFGTMRPNIYGTPGQEDQTSMGLGLDGRYRMTKNDSITLGSTFAMMTPFQGNVSDKGTQLNVYDPVVAYNRAFAGIGLQQILSVSVSAGTSQASKGIAKTGSIGLSHNGLKEFKNGLSLGMATDLTYFGYDNKPGQNPQNAMPSYGGDDRADWSLAFFPYAEYAISDRYAVRSVFGYFNFQHLYGDANRGRLLKTSNYQSVGVGIAVTRDVYLYPNVQFVPDNIRSDFTNLAFNATINMF